MNQKNSLPKFNKLQALLTEHGNTYSDLSEVLDCSETTIQLKLNGKRKWNWAEMVAIKNHYNLDADKFISVFNFF